MTRSSAGCSAQLQVGREPAPLTTQSHSIARPAGRIDLGDRRRSIHRPRRTRIRTDTRSHRRARCCYLQDPPSPRASTLDRSTGSQAARRGPRKGTDSRWQRRYTLYSRNTTAASSRQTMEPEAIELTSPMCRPPRRSPTATPVGTPPPRRQLPRDQTFGFPGLTTRVLGYALGRHRRSVPTLRPAGHTRQRTPQARGRPRSRRGLRLTPGEIERLEEPYGSGPIAGHRLRSACTDRADDRTAGSGQKPRS
jgi:hypothetical protein